MSESKVFMFPESGASNGELVSLLAPLLSLRGLDPNLLLMNRGSYGFGGDDYDDEFETRGRMGRRSKGRYEY